MSRWDADLQQWVDDDEPPPRGAHSSAGYEPTEPDLPLVRVSSGAGAPRGPSREAILAGAVAGVVLVAGIGFGVWKLTRDDGGNHASGPGGTTSTAPATPGLGDGGVSTTGGTGGAVTMGGGTGATPDAPTGGSGGYSVSSGSTGTSGSAGSSGSADGSGGSGSSGGAGAAPAGYQRVSDSSGITLDVPQGWHRTADGISVFYRSAPDGQNFIQVYRQNGPESTPAEAAAALEATMSKNPGYRRLGLGQTSDGSQAELEYTYTRDGGTRHVVLRDVRAPDHQMYVLLVTGPDDEWSSYARVYAVLLGSFCPTGYCASGG
ncbi:hypothetical protein ACH427_05280 [Streptomyces sp. NPDC020379]|uniref:hypothetical protein n=1 Tax=Streptomyces sp. NPDC020379 TaxID=3365071 RepID=UPI00379B826D